MKIRMDEHDVVTSVVSRLDGRVVQLRKSVALVVAALTMTLFFGSILCLLFLTKTTIVIAPITFCSLVMLILVIRVSC